MNKKNECVRCGSVATITLDMGKMGLLGLCPVCWVGLAGCLARDFEIYKEFDKDYMQEFQKASERREFFRLINK